MVAWWILLLPAFVTGALVSEDTLARRSLRRFRKGDSENSRCWERHGVDGFLTVIDSHNHFRPFFGPEVPFHTYIDWMLKHGILFSTMFGIGQTVVKEKGNPNDPDCCYYLHCPGYKIVPDPKNDRLNALDYEAYQKDPDLTEKIHLTLSLTFPNLQVPKRMTNTIYELESQHQNMFKWAGEINVFKHALASNGFFNQSRVTVERIEAGELDGLFNYLSTKKWPTTLHCDLGCDNYDGVPVHLDHGNPLEGCEVPQSELRRAAKNFDWWRIVLGPYYHSFFDTYNQPRQTFSKIQHLEVWNAILARFPKLIVVWAHLGLSKELKDLHPNIHAHIMKGLFEKYPNLYADVSWDVLAKQNLMNHNKEPVGRLHPENHTDFNQDVSFLFDSAEVDKLRNDLHKTWETHEKLVTEHGTVTGPTHSMAIYLEMFHQYPDRFLTGTDFVASMGPKEQYPGTLNKNGCMKDQANHARQMTDTSSINMFFDDETFKKIVLGENYFRITGLDSEFQAPPVCGDSGLPIEVVIGVSVGVALLVVLLVIIGLVVWFCRKSDSGNSFTRVGENRSATTNG